MTQSFTCSRWPHPPLALLSPCSVSVAEAPQIPVTKRWKTSNSHIKKQLTNLSSGISKNYYYFVADFNNTGDLFFSVADITIEESKVYHFSLNLKKILRSRKRDMIHEKTFSWKAEHQLLLTHLSVVFRLTPFISSAQGTVLLIYLCPDVSDPALKKVSHLMLFWRFWLLG